MKLFQILKISNRGTEAAHVRLHNMNQGIVKLLQFMNVKQCGVPAGLSVEAVVELEVPVTTENIYDVLLLKTEEEILAVPITI